MFIILKYFVLCTKIVINKNLQQISSCGCVLHCIASTHVHWPGNLMLQSFTRCPLQRFAICSAGISHQQIFRSNKCNSAERSKQVGIFLRLKLSVTDVIGGWKKYQRWLLFFLNWEVSRLNAAKSLFSKKKLRRLGQNQITEWFEIIALTMFTMKVPLSALIS